MFKNRLSLIIFPLGTLTTPSLSSCELSPQSISLQMEELGALEGLLYLLTPPTYTPLRQAPPFVTHTWATRQTSC